MDLDKIQKLNKHKTKEYDISVVIHSWNNLPYLKNCVASIRKNSKLNIQIIVIINEGKDGTHEWVIAQADVDYIYSPVNLGVCLALNAARPLIQSSYLAYVNDDMYLLPDWDAHLMSEIKSFGTKKFFISATVIEPVDTGNLCVIVKDYGDSLESFEEERLLREFRDLEKEDWSGSSWPPNVIHIDLWDLVGGYSIEYSPGFYSDPDFSKKLYDVGVRIFKGCSQSRAYHFATKSTKRVRRNNGRLSFLLKHGISARYFYRKVLKMGKPFERLKDNHQITFLDRLTHTIKSILAVIRKK
jgi:glycosyltransferase involved in cell wall biosynthesis